MVSVLRSFRAKHGRTRSIRFRYSGRSDHSLADYPEWPEGLYRGDHTNSIKFTLGYHLPFLQVLIPRLKGMS